MDAMRGDATLFTRDDEVAEQWRIIDPILERWGSEKDGALPTYLAGSGGPVEAAQLLLDGHAWRTI
jgi:glucose-6-phosphate 1-dehydrogenase